ncbi:MAG: TetR/AcrR family transcriptional regulator [Erysipelotrichaceae bacterium]
MAQILKDDVRNNIIKAARNHFVLYGVEKAKMREIAIDANMTVGNLYRYYESKEALLQAVVLPCMDDLDKLIEKISENKLSLSKEVKDVEIDQLVIVKNFNVLIDELVDISVKYPIEMNIIAKNDEMISNITNWLNSVYHLLFVNNGYDEVLINMISISTISAFKEAFKNNEKCDIKKVILQYLTIIVNGMR